MLLKTWAASESPSRLTHPDLNAPAGVTRKIHLECPLAIEYHSISSGRTERESIPFALIDNGLRWHVRAFDRKSREFWAGISSSPGSSALWCSKGSPWLPTRQAIRTFSGSGLSS